VPQAPIGTNIHQSLDIERDLRSQAPLDLIVVFYNLPENVDLLRGQIVNPSCCVDTCAGTDRLCRRASDSKYLGQSNIHVFVGEINPGNSSHVLLLLLALLVLGILADDAYNAFSTDHLAFITNRFHTYSYLHLIPPPVLQVPGSDLSLTHDSLMMVHAQLTFDLTHRVQVHTYHNQKRSAAH